MKSMKLLLLTALTAAVPMVANAFSFGMNEDDFSFGSRSDGYDNRPYGRAYGPYSGTAPRADGAGPYGPGRGEGARSGFRAGGPDMRWGPAADEQSADAADAEQPAARRPSRSQWDDDGVQFSRSNKWNMGGSRMNWGNRWRPNFGGGRYPGYGPSWGMNPGWNQYPTGPNPAYPYPGAMPRPPMMPAPAAPEVPTPAAPPQ